MGTMALSRVRFFMMRLSISSLAWVKKGHETRVRSRLHWKMCPFLPPTLLFFGLAEELHAIGCRGGVRCRAFATAKSHKSADRLRVSCGQAGAWPCLSDGQSKAPVFAGFIPDGLG